MQKGASNEFRPMIFLPIEDSALFIQYKIYIHYISNYNIITEKIQICTGEK